MGGILIVLSLVGFGVGLWGLAFGRVRWARIGSRGAAALFVGASFVLFIVGAATLPSSPSPAATVGAPTRSAATPTAVARPVTATAAAIAAPAQAATATARSTYAPTLTAAASSAATGSPVHVSAVTGAVVPAGGATAVSERQQVTGQVPGPSTCHYRTAADGRPLPDPACTPGAADPRVTQADIAQTICVSGYTTTVRPETAETDAAKRQLMLAYTQTRPNELDHLIPLELGGSSDVSNLWPEPPPAPNPKDSVENHLHGLVCAGKLSLSRAQYLIAANWTTAVALAKGQQAAASIPAPAATTSNATTAGTSPASTTPAASSSPASTATAQCRDGTYSYSQHRRGTCSHHGGVAVWINRPPS